jgi:type II secretory pathway component PulF
MLSEPTLRVVWSLMVHGSLYLVPVLVISYVTYYLISLPARRREQGRLFLQLLDLWLRNGRPLEQTIISAANSRDRSIGLRFHLAAAYVEEGHRLPVALEKSRLLPRAVVAMIAAGEHAGDIRKVLPACHTHMIDARSGLRSAMNYLLVLILGLAPAALFLLRFVKDFISPKVVEIFEAMSEGALPAWLQFFLSAVHIGFWIEAAMLIILGITAFLYLIGPDTPDWLRRIALSATDLVAWRVPWKRSRIKRNFTAILAVLLDAGMPESVALRLAGMCSANCIFERRVASVIAQLSSGIPLPKALATLDDGGELHWRLTNAIHERSSFSIALRGWLDALDARAFQQEQTAAHLLSTLFVVVNGVVVGCVCAAFFGMLVELTNRTALW